MSVDLALAEPATDASRIAARWSDALAAYRQYLAPHEEMTPADEIRLKYLRAFAAFASSIAIAPWAVTGAHLTAYLDARQLQRKSAESYRRHLRVFYEWAVTTGRAPAQPIPGRILHRGIADGWAAALDAFAIAESRRGVAATTTEVRLKNLRAFARDVDEPNPYHVRQEQILEWLGRTAGGAQLASSRRGSLRAFYRWAQSAGKRIDDPCEEPSRRATTRLAGPHWEREIAAWRRAMVALGRTAPTISLRSTRIRAFAITSNVEDPYAVTIDDLTDYLAARRWASETRRSFRATVRSFYGWAEDTGRITHSPATRLAAVRTPIVNGRPAAEHDYALALSRADHLERLGLRLAAELGLRCAEISTVHSSDVRQGPNGWTIIVHGKGRRERTLPLTDDLLTALHARPIGYAFPGQVAGHVSPGWLSKRLCRLLPRGVTLHQLRHRFASIAYNIDRDMITVQRLLGHASPATTQRYLAVPDDRMRTLASAAQLRID